VLEAIQNRFTIADILFEKKPSIRSDHAWIVNPEHSPRPRQESRIYDHADRTILHDAYAVI
jgi:hypothetical protein